MNRLTILATAGVLLLIGCSGEDSGGNSGGGGGDSGLEAGADAADAAPTCADAATANFCCCQLDVLGKIECVDGKLQCAPGYNFVPLDECYQCPGPCCLWVDAGAGGGDSGLEGGSDAADAAPTCADAATADFCCCQLDVIGPIECVDGKLQCTPGYNSVPLNQCNQCPGPCCPSVDAGSDQ